MPRFGMKRRFTKRTASRGRKFRKLRRTRPNTFRRRPVTGKRKYLKRSRLAIARSTTVGAGHSAENTYPNYKRTPDRPWWATIKRMNTPASLVGYAQTGMGASIGTKQWYSHFLHMSPFEITGMLAYFAGTSAALPASNADKFYMFDLTRTHEWRNSCNATVQLEWFVGFPRRDIPQYTKDSGGTLRACPSIAPFNVGNDANTLNPISAFSRDFSDRGTDGSIAAISYTDPAATLFMSPTVTSAVKLKPLVLQWPNGQKSHQGMLEAGQTLRLISGFRKPRMYSYNKLFTNGTWAYKVENTWQCLKETPLIFVSVRGTNSHDKDTNTNINFGLARLDYTCTVKFNAILTQTIPSVTGRYTQQMNSITTAQQTIPVTAVETDEAT